MRSGSRSIGVTLSVNVQFLDHTDRGLGIHDELSLRVQPSPAVRLVFDLSDQFLLAHFGISMHLPTMPCGSGAILFGFGSVKLTSAALHSSIVLQPSHSTGSVTPDGVITHQTRTIFSIVVSTQQAATCLFTLVAAWHVPCRIAHDEIPYAFSNRVKHDQGT